MNALFKIIWLFLTIHFIGYAISYASDNDVTNDILRKSLDDSIKQSVIANLFNSNSYNFKHRPVPDNLSPCFGIVQCVDSAGNRMDFLTKNDTTVVLLIRAMFGDLCFKDYVLCDSILMTIESPSREKASEAIYEYHIITDCNID